jgi:hypothetical protein
MDRGGRLHHNDRFEATRPHPVEPRPDKPINGAQPQTAGTLTIEDHKLVNQRD